MASVAWISTADCFALFALAFMGIAASLGGVVKEQKKTIDVLHQLPSRDRELELVTDKLTKAIDEIGKLNSTLDAARSERGDEANKHADALQQAKKELVDSDLRFRAQVESERKLHASVLDALSAQLKKAESSRIRAEEEAKLLSTKSEPLVSLHKRILARLQVPEANLLKELDRVFAEFVEQGRTLVASKGAVTRLTDEIEMLKQRGTGELSQKLLGLKGARDRVVFVVDRSGSMEVGGRWNEVQSTIETWIDTLEIPTAGLVLFSSGAQVFPDDGKMVPLATWKKQFIEVIRRTSPEGGTDTVAGLDRAFKMRDSAGRPPTQIILFTDGRPTEGGRPAANKSSDDYVTEVLEVVRRYSSESGSVPVNVIALGDYFDRDFGKFLVRLAKETGGTFIGR